MGSFHSQDRRTDILRLMVPFLDLDGGAHCPILHELSYLYSGNSEQLFWLIQRLGCSFRNLSRREKNQYSKNLLSRRPGQRVPEFQSDAARLVWHFFEENPSVCGITDRVGISLLHGIAGDINLVVDEQIHRALLLTEELMEDESSPLNPNVRQRSSDMLLMLRGLVSACSNKLHGLAVYCTGLYDCRRCFRLSARLQTPFMAIISGYFNSRLYISKLPSRKSWPATTDQATSAATVWLEQLKSAGIDLVEYGRKEKQIHNEKHVGKEWLCFTGSKVLLIRLNNFTYGPEPSDWRFWFSEMMES